MHGGTFEMLARKIEGHRVPTFVNGLRNAVAVPNVAHISSDTTVKVTVIRLGLEKSAFISPGSAFPHLNAVVFQKNSILKPLFDRK